MSRRINHVQLIFPPRYPRNLHIIPQKNRTLLCQDNLNTTALQLDIIHYQQYYVVSVWKQTNDRNRTLEAIVIPRSRSRLMESMARSWGISAPHWRKSRSMSVVLPWSTWAMTATLRSRLGSSVEFGDTAAAAALAAVDKARADER